MSSADFSASAARSDASAADIGWTPVRIAVVALSFLLNALDGMDIVIMSYIAPVLAADWGLTPENLGVVFSASLAGMTVGCLFVAPLADKWGRRPLILGMLSIITFCMLISSFAQTLAELVAARFIIGIGIGAILAGVTAIAADFAPPARRGLVVSMAIAGYPLGAVTTGLLSAHLLPVHGWRFMLLGAGIISLVVIPVIFLILPESQDYLLRKQPRNALARLNKLRSRLGEGVLDRLPPKPAATRTYDAGEVFGGGRTIGTLCLWLGIFMGFMTFYFVVSWITQLSVRAGLPLDRAIYAGALFNLGGFVGTLVVGWLGSRHGLPRVTTITMMIAACLIALFGALSMPLALTLAMAFLAGMATNGGFNAFYGLAAELYPAAVRSTGIGWAMGVGRFGAVIGPLLGGWLIGQGVTLSTLMAIFALPLLIAAAAAWFIRAR